MIQSKCTDCEPAAPCNVLQLTYHRHAWNAALQVCEPGVQALEPCKVCVLAAQEALKSALKSQEWEAALLSMVHCPPAVSLNFRGAHSRQETSCATGDLNSAMYAAAPYSTFALRKCRLVSTGSTVTTASSQHRLSEL